jgi:hypothetical protein
MASEEQQAFVFPIPFTLLQQHFDPLSFCIHVKV